MRPSIRVYKTVEVFDRKGKRVYRKRVRSRSFVQAFLYILYTQMISTTNGSIPDTGNTSRTLADTTVNVFRCDETAGSVLKGLRVGTGSTAVAVTDYALETPIAHGVGSGQLSHSATTLVAPSVADPNCSFTIQRDFTNSSGATINVWEEGLYVICGDSGSVERYFMVIRDVEASAVAVADGQNLRVTYTIQTST